METNKLPLFWHNSSNFGDAIAPYIAKKITGKEPEYTSNEWGRDCFAIVGSLLDAAPLHHVSVWGCGFAYADSPAYPPKSISAVRGKLSRQKYLENNIDCPEVYGDPALLLPQFYSPKIEKKYKIGIIPHVIDYIQCLKMYANRSEDYLIIDLNDGVEQVIDQILSCEATISSSLHGLIVSHAYGIPSQWVEFSDKVLGNGFKFRDYFTTVIPNYFSADILNSIAEPKIIPIDLRSYKDLDTIFIPDFKININLAELLKSCPLNY